jgi:PHP domain
MKNLLVAVAAAATVNAMQTSPHFVTAVPWYGQGVWLRADFHTHTQFTDGAHSVETVVAAAASHGCDVVAITDHGDRNLKGGTPEFVDAIRAARAGHPNITVITGMEWNVPPGRGNEHATILFPSSSESADVLGRFRDRFDDQLRNDPPAESAQRGLASLVPTGEQTLAPVVFFTHPSRIPDSPSASKTTFEALWQDAPSILIGIEGGPGHQRGTPLGAYPGGGLIDRWDPLVAQVDGTWDLWLRHGLTVWAAIANSDFHDESRDFWPCEFAATWLYAPDRTVDGVIRAMRAGSFFAEHGHIVSNVALQVSLAGLPRPAQAGETVSASVGLKGTVSLRMDVSSTDFLGRANRIDSVELIAISKDKSEIVYSAPPSTPVAFSVELTVPPGGLVVRARGRRNVNGEPALMFYTNPIRITASER